MCQQSDRVLIQVQRDRRKSSERHHHALPHGNPFGLASGLFPSLALGRLQSLVVGALPLLLFARRVSPPCGYRTPRKATPDIRSPRNLRLHPRPVVEFPHSEEDYESPRPSVPPQAIPPSPCMQSRLKHTLFVLSSRRVRPAPPSRDVSPLRAHPRDALAHGHRLFCSAHHRRRNRHFPPALLPGRNREREHEAPLHAAHRLFARHCPYWQAGHARRERLEPLPSFPGRVALRPHRICLLPLWPGHRPLPTQYPPGSRQPFVARLPRPHRQLSTPRATRSRRSPLLQRSAARRLLHCHLRSLPAHYLDGPGHVARLHLRVSLVRDPARRPPNRPHSSFLHLVCRPPLENK